MAFTCYVHDFSTDEIEEWDKHLQDKEHEAVGTAPCNLCGLQTDFKFKGKRTLARAPCICEECKKGF